MLQVISAILLVILVFGLNLSIMTEPARKQMEIERMREQGYVPESEED